MFQVSFSSPAQRLFLKSDMMYSVKCINLEQYNIHIITTLYTMQRFLQLDTKLSERSKD